MAGWPWPLPGEGKFADNKLQVNANQRSGDVRKYLIPFA